MCVVYRFLTYQNWFSYNLDMSDMLPAESSSNNWDPISETVDSPPLMLTASIRIKKDLMSLYQDPPPGIFATACDSDIRNIHALIVGPMDTPYEGGMFYFFLRCPYDFPIKPPKVRFMTTDAGRVRFNPNLYNCGKVCLSIIGTWSGPCWTPAQQISSLLISIQSLMSENPISNEPGFETRFRPNEAAHYSKMITHETLRVAVVGMVNNECKLNMPAEFTPIIERTFLQYYDVYVEICNKYLHLDGRKYKDPINPIGNCVYNFKNILTKLKEIKDNLTNKMAQSDKKVKLPSSDGDGEVSDYKEDEDEQIDENNVREFLDISSGSSSNCQIGDENDEDIESCYKELIYSAEESGDEEQIHWKAQ